MDKPEIDYPCQWSYKVIGSEKDHIQKTIELGLKERNYTLSISKKSKSGKYTSFNVELFVESEKERDFFFGMLREIESVKFVL